MVYSEKPKLHARQKAYKKGNLRSIVFDVTPRCNMACPHCSAAPFSSVKPISLEELKEPLEIKRFYRKYVEYLRGDYSKAKETVYLYRYFNEEWTRLNTNYISTDSEKYHFTHGF